MSKEEYDMDVDEQGQFIAVEGERTFTSDSGQSWSWTQTAGPPIERPSVLKRVWHAVRPGKREALYSAALVAIVFLAAIYFSRAS